MRGTSKIIHVVSKSNCAEFTNWKRCRSETEYYNLLVQYVIWIPLMTINFCTWLRNVPHIHRFLFVLVLGKSLSTAEPSAMQITNKYLQCWCEINSQSGFSFSTQKWHFCTKLASWVLKSFNRNKIASSGIWTPNSSHFLDS